MLASSSRLALAAPLLRSPLVLSSRLGGGIPRRSLSIVVPIRQLETVQLAYEAHAAPAGSASKVGDTKAVVVAHGLFGSKQNWRSIARGMAKRWGVDVYAVDLRNHGTSPHASSMSYADHAADLIRFLADHKLSDIALIGHSMGGKAAQTVALELAPLKDASPLKALVSVDMTPARGPLSPEFMKYTDAMIEIEDAKCSSRKEADEILTRTEPDAGVRSFLLTNLEKPNGAAYWTWRIPVKRIVPQLEGLGDFRFDPPGSSTEGREERAWDGKTLFVKGAKSKYINRKNIPICDAYFPRAQHVTLDAGHWVQAERPQEFVEVVERFLRDEPVADA